MEYINITNARYINYPYINTNLGYGTGLETEYVNIPTYTYYENRRNKLFKKCDELFRDMRYAIKDLKFIINEKRKDYIYKYYPKVLANLILKYANY